MSAQQDYPELQFVQRDPQPHWREGVREYDVLVFGNLIGRVRRDRERYPGTKIGKNVVTKFHSRWAWRNSRDSRWFDTREQAVAALREAVLG